MNFALLTTSTQTATQPSTIASYVIGVIIIALAFYFIYKKTKTTKDGQVELNSFLNKIQDTIKAAIADFIGQVDFTNLQNTDFVTIESVLFVKLYNELYDVCMEELQKVYKDDPIEMALLQKLLTKEKIKSYMETIWSSDDIKKKFEELYNTAIAAKLQEAKKADEALEKEQDTYDNGTAVVEPAPETPVAEAPVINPPKEEEDETVSKDDASVEILGEAEHHDNLII